MRQLDDSIELTGAVAEVNVLPEEYIRLLGYPRGWVLEGRALELANWAREWYAAHGKPWFYARQAESVEIHGDSILIDGVSFESTRLRGTLEQAGAHSVVLVAVGAGQEAEDESHRRWEQEKPDEYFFLEIFGSAVVESLTTRAGAKLCDWAEQHDMAVLPHYSPGYPEWNVAEQPRLLELIQSARNNPFSFQLEALESGMLRPRKALLAVFGLTRHTERLRRLTGLVPCESCSFGPCQYRRAPYRRNPQPTGEQFQVPLARLDQNAAYSINRKALKRWSAERLSMCEAQDGSIDVVFRYDGTTCTNMGWPLQFLYNVKLGPRVEGYPILEQRCSPASGDTGHTRMCQYLENPSRLMAAIDHEKPLSGKHLEEALAWHPESNSAGCFCTQTSRDHKWKLVFETIHYALAQQELSQDKER